MGRLAHVQIVAAIGATLLTAACAPTACGQSSPARVSVALTALGHSHASPRAVRLLLVIPAGWHIGVPADDAPGTTGLPTRLEWTTPRGWRVSRVRWPTPEHQIQGKDTVRVYTGRVTVDALLDAPTGIPAGPVRVRVAYGLCRDVCIPGWATATLNP